MSAELLCVTCGNGFRPGESMLTMENEYFHQDCFRCSGPCGLPLGCTKWFQVKSKPMCEKCYDMSQPDSICTRCNRKITVPKDGSEVTTVTSGGKTYHSTCFTCQNCNAMFHGGSANDPAPSVYSVEDKIFCKACAEAAIRRTQELNTEKCSSCGKPSLSMVEAKGRKLCTECFVCVRCNTSLVGTPFLTLGVDTLSCQPCFVEVDACIACGKPVKYEGAGGSMRFVRTGEKSVYHEHCYVCSAEGCGISLMKTDKSCAYLSNGKLVCRIHADGPPGAKILKPQEVVGPNASGVEATPLKKKAESLSSLLILQSEQEPAGTRLTLSFPKRNGKLGLQLASGHHEGGKTRAGIFVRSIAKGGIADCDGKLRVRDQILGANGVRFDGLSLEAATNLMTSDSPTLTLEIFRMGTFQTNKERAVYDNPQSSSVSAVDYNTGARASEKRAVYENPKSSSVSAVDYNAINPQGINQQGNGSFAGYEVPTEGGYSVPNDVAAGGGENHGRSVSSPVPGGAEYAEPEAFREGIDNIYE